ncbi:hypothetical protein [Cryptosporangium arvum]|uniref:Dinucleotide-utilizing enzyme possibly involved in molybdopterin or thiamin biosynthesis n=1 Tax=Cryptosporangium arvum DSM 44712 TaxID=927661 RepID=A0A010ZP87_9ACTN|nr:hypothetical protein [Cryptosporangium arvum]EXG80499.1 hypothetical protein CryarDRAFT_1577 [Cryptosporangium arvum DSM 44712]
MTDHVTLAPGHHLFRGADDVWRLYAPGDQITRIGGPDEALAHAQNRLHNTAEAGGGELVDELERGLARRGALAQPVRADSQAAQPWTVVVAGDNPIGRAVRTLLEPYADLRPPCAGALTEDDVRAADTIVTCGGWLTDQAWSALDDWCRRHGTAWHLSYVEGTRHYLGPMYVPGRTASYRDTRGRRLAASGVPDELRGFWAYLESDAALPPVPWPDPAGAAVVAGLLVGDLLRYRRTGTPAAAGHQLGFDPAHATVTRHPVLPLPETASVPAGTAR